MSKNSFKMGKKAMQKWGIKSKNLTLVDPFKDGVPAAFLSSKPAQNFENKPLAPQKPR